jgi:hypothetical protein
MVRSDLTPNMQHIRRRYFSFRLSDRGIFITSINRPGPVPCVSSVPAPKNIRETFSDRPALRIRDSRKIPACFSDDECGRLIPVCKRADDRLARDPGQIAEVETARPAVDRVCEKHSLLYACDGGTWRSVRDPEERHIRTGVLCRRLSLPVPAVFRDCAVCVHQAPESVLVGEGIKFVTRV